MGLIPENSGKDSSKLKDELHHLHSFDDKFIDLFDYDDYDLTDEEREVYIAQTFITSVQVMKQIVTGMIDGRKSAAFFRDHLREAKKYQDIMINSGLENKLL